MRVVASYAGGPHDVRAGVADGRSPLVVFESDVGHGRLVAQELKCITFKIVSRSTRVGPPWEWIVTVQTGRATRSLLAQSIAEKNTQRRRKRDSAGFLMVVVGHGDAVIFYPGDHLGGVEGPKFLQRLSVLAGAFLCVGSDEVFFQTHKLPDQQAETEGEDQGNHPCRPIDAAQGNGSSARLFLANHDRPRFRAGLFPVASWEFTCSRRGIAPLS